jgi:hypothetical protein
VTWVCVGLRKPRSSLAGNLCRPLELYTAGRSLARAKRRRGARRLCRWWWSLPWRRFRERIIVLEGDWSHFVG